MLTHLLQLVAAQQVYMVFIYTQKKANMAFPAAGIFA